MKPISSALPAALLVAGLATTPFAFGCSICGCSLSSDWMAQGYSSRPGWQAQLRYEYSDATDLRHAGGSAEPAAITYPAEDEIQRETINRVTWLGLDYTTDDHWGASGEVPYLNRYHSTIMDGDTAASESRASGLGDLRLLGRYQHIGMWRGAGVQIGLKLPTGRIDQPFATGPGAGMPLDRGLQLGTGTTDFLAGLSWFERPMPSLGCFAQVLADVPLHERAGFRPSSSVTVSGGVRYLNTTTFTPQLQCNVRWDTRERGANADVPNSGGVLAYLSPGVTSEIGERATAFAFVQLPVYQRVNGLQLEPKWIVSLGITFRR